MFHPRKYQRSFHVKHSTSSQKLAMHSLFNIPVFQAAFSWVLIVKATLFYKGKLNSKCAYIAQNARWITSVLSDDIDAILPCTAIYNQPKFSHYALANERWIITVLSDDSVAILPCTAIYNQPKFSLSLYVQYTIVSSCFLTLYCTVSKYILHGKSAYSVRLHCTESAMNYKCFIRIYRCDPAM